MTEVQQATHTPGPWNAIPSPIGRHHYVMANEDGIETATHMRNEMALVYSGDANARLIAAAPELLEACQAVVGGGTYGEYGDATRDLLDAAIAKATGVQS